MLKEQDVLNGPSLGTLRRVEPRTIWKSEAGDLTPWLANNLAMLGEALGLELELEEREGKVGGFSVDIVAREVGENRVVVIENQLEPTDHGHLGQLLTYAAGREAGVVVWISPEFRDEHRQTLDWLNRDGGQGTQFFGVVVELLQIDQSPPAVNFRPVAFPNDWTREVRAEAASEVSERRLAYRDFFQRLIDSLRSKQFTNARAGQPQSWYSFAAGISGFSYSTAFAGGDQLRVELYLGSSSMERNKETFEKLYDQREAIASEFGEPLEWERLDGRKSARIALYRPGSIELADQHDEYLSWCVEHLLKLKKVFASRLRGHFHATCSARGRSSPFSATSPGSATWREPTCSPILGGTRMTRRQMGGDDCPRLRGRNKGCFESGSSPGHRGAGRHRQGASAVRGTRWPNRTRAPYSSPSVWCMAQQPDAAQAPCVATRGFGRGVGDRRGRPSPSSSGAAPWIGS